MTTTDERSQAVLDHWNSRADLGAAAGSNDLIAKRLEIDAILSHVRDGMRVLDAGCGNGVTAIEIARNHNVDVMGLDYAKNMVQAASDRARTETLQGTVQFQTGDVCNLPENLERFDLIYTERVLINLSDWSSQQAAIAGLAAHLNPGGKYVMCENSQTGLDAINGLRHCVGLSTIHPPWHNRYLEDSEIESLVVEGLRLQEINSFSATYYFLSRVVNAVLAEQEGKEPAYDAPVNQLALQLPAIGDTAQVKAWVWRRGS